jgi:heat-inducible transcriptional repressor
MRGGLALRIMECQRAFRCRLRPTSMGAVLRHEWTDMLNERRRQVLQALVAEYISSAQPVGSKSLVDRYELGCSPATVRNELAILEETGFVYQPHVSAGRVPTDSGYRTFVDELLEKGESLDVTNEVDGALFFRSVEVDELMRETSSVLSELTDYMAVVVAPTVSLARIRRVDLLAMEPRRALLVLIPESGRIVERHVELAQDASPERLADIERSLNAALVGKRAVDVRPLRQAIDADHPGDAMVARIIEEIIDALEEADRDRLYHLGIPALLNQPEFHDAEAVRPLLLAIEDGIAMLETLAEVIATTGVTVRIGHENLREELDNVSLVATHYGMRDSDGIVGVIGPTRMNYLRAIAAVRAVAERLSDTLG